MTKYPLIMRITHWIMAALILTLLGVGMWMEGLPDTYPGKYDYYALHKSFGVVALLFVIFRISVRLRSAVPKLPAEITKFDSMLSTGTIALLYLCMLGMPLSGYFMSTFGGYPVSMFGIPIPSIFEKNPELGKFFREMHGLGGWMLIVLISLHLLGTLKHYLIEKVNLLQRIW